MKYNPTKKPDPRICPRQYCFMWRMARLITPEAEEPPLIAEGCRCPFGVCTRLDPASGKRDYYEDHGPNLRAAGLPWFYFYPSPASLVPDKQKEYIAETEILWGEEHWR